MFSRGNGWDHCWCSAAALHVQGVGPVAPAFGSFGNVSTPGTVSMFAKEGFEAVAVLGAPSARVRASITFLTQHLGNPVGAAGYLVLMRKVV